MGGKITFYLVLVCFFIWFLIISNAETKQIRKENAEHKYAIEQCMKNRKKDMNNLSYCQAQE